MAAAVPADPAVAKGKQSSNPTPATPVHRDAGDSTALAPKLTGISAHKSKDEWVTPLKTPAAKATTRVTQPVGLPVDQMHSLLAYLPSGEVIKNYSHRSIFRPANV